MSCSDTSPEIDPLLLRLEFTYEALQVWYPRTLNAAKYLVLDLFDKTYYVSNACNNRFWILDYLTLVADIMKFMDYPIFDIHRSSL
jgi:hypothetical protein